jgi:hypothetical protein
MSARLRIPLLSLVILCLGATAAAAEKSCDRLLADIPSYLVARVNHHFEVPTVAWLKWGGQYGNGVASVYQVEIPDLYLSQPITRVFCARLEEGRYDSAGLSFDLRIDVNKLDMKGFSESTGALTNQKYYRCLDIDRCSIAVRDGG